MTVMVKGVSKRFGDVQALESVSIACAPGQVLGILGPNGAGKTTLLRIIAALLKPDSGTVRVMDADAALDAAAVRRNIGYISGETGLYERLTPDETMVFFGRLNGMDDSVIAARTDEVFTMLGITPFRGQRNAGLSSGMKQKVSLGRAIIHDPAVLILDEPTAYLDVMAARAVTAFIRSAGERGRCVIYAGHNMDEAERICTHVAFINNGRIIESGPLTGIPPGGLNGHFFRLMEPGQVLPAAGGTL